MSANVANEHLAQAVASLCAAIRIEAPPPDANGRYVIPFDEGMELRCFALGGRNVLEGVVRPLPEDRLAEETLLRKLLAAALGKASDRAETLHLDEESREIRLHRRLPQDMVPGADFVRAVEQFLNELEFWRRHAAEGSQPGRISTPMGLRP